MPIFIYKGVTASNSEISGEIEANSRNDALTVLRKKKVRTLSLHKKSTAFSFTIGSRVKLPEVSRFTRQFAAMISAGLPLVKCMDILSHQTENKNLANAANQISIDVQSGKPLAESLGKHPKIFNNLYCNMVAAGEKSGSLDTVLIRLTEYLEKANSLIRKVRGAMIYPIILGSVAAAGVILLLTFVVPSYEKMFTNLGGELPLPTRIVMAVSDFFQPKSLLIIALTICALIILIRRYYKTEKGAYVLDSFMLKLPVIGDIQRKSSISRFSQTLSTLLNSGINIISALSITAKTAGNKVLEMGIINTIEKISTGQSIAEPLEATGLFPPMVIQMIAVGEKTGDISSMLNKIHSFYEEEVDAAVDAITSVLEPILIILLGITIGGILIAMYLPMFNMLNLIG